MSVRLLIIDNDDSFTYNLVQTLARYNCRAVVRRHNTFRPEEAAAFDKIIFSPGPGTPDEYPVMNQLLAQYEGSKSILGVCLGHQAIALHYGAQIVNLTGVYHGQRRRIDVLDPAEQLFEGLPASAAVGLYHSWAVTHEKFPDDLHITSVSEDGIIMSLAHSRFDVRGVQFHPESIITELGHRMLANWLKY